jgi:hypothetical protein
LSLARGSSMANCEHENSAEEGSHSTNHINHPPQKKGGTPHLNCHLDEAPE